MPRVGVATDTQVRRDFLRAQQRVLDRYGVDAESRFVHTPVLNGDTHVLTTGEGPPVMMVIGGGLVAGLWAPLLARLGGFTLYALDLPGHGLTAPVDYRTETLRRVAVDFLTQILDGLELASVPFISQSMGGLWTTWLALERPERVAAISYVGCPALFLGTSAPLPLRISTIGPLVSLLNKLDPPSPKQVNRMVRMAGEDLSAMPELVALYLAHEKMPASARALIDLVRAAVRIRGAQPEVELTAEQLGEISQPIQMIWGDNDPFGPPSVGERVAEIVSGARLHVVPAGHGPWFTQSEVMAPIIDSFIRENT